jgi:nicotinic acid mononucleotide adenylyltransferase
MEKVNIVLGRFQPFTLGHLKCCTNTYKKTGLKTVLCIIDTIKTDARHPFSTQLLWPAFKELVNDYEEIQDIALVKCADIVKIKEILEKKDYEIVSFTCGTDRYNMYKKMCNRYAPEIKVIEIQRSDDDISATQVRNSIKMDNKKTFEKLTPAPIHKIYDKLKKSLDDV